MQITVGAGLKMPLGTRVEVPTVGELAAALSANPDSVEGWWAPHLWSGDYRDSEAWEGAWAVGVDIDQDGHADLVGRVAERLEAAAAAGALSGNIFHRTPAGARIIFVFDKVCTNAEWFVDAAEGAAQAVAADLVEQSIEGLSVDPRPHKDLARLYFLPNTTAKGRRRSAAMVVMRHEPYLALDLSELRQAAKKTQQATIHRLSVPATSNVRRAAAYVARMGPSIEGNRGDDHAFRVAAALVRDFALDDSEAWSVINEWNGSCQPPWPESDLRRFLRSAEKNGSGGVGQKLMEARPQPQSQRQAPTAQAPAAAPREIAKGIPLVRACDAVEKPVEWVIENFLAKGELTDLSGDPGVGKGGITASWAARITKEHPDATVIFFATEDPLGRVKARLRAEGADLSRVLLLDITQPNASPILPGDIDLVEALVREHNAMLLILDPALEFMEASLDSHKQQDVARFMAPLLSVAQRTGAALLTVRHLNKGGGTSALYRASGSIGFTGKVRIALLASKAGDSGARALAVTKNNLGKDRHTVGFDVVSSGDASVITWGDVMATSADELVNQEPGKKHGPAPAKMEAAADLLRSMLSGGPMKCDDVIRCAKAEGVSRSLVYEAKKSLGIVSCTIELASGWRLP